MFLTLIAIIIIVGINAYFIRSECGSTSLTPSAIAVLFSSIAVLYLLRQAHQEGYRMLQISPGALCQGGKYMWTGDTPEAKMCRALYDSPEGRCQVQQFNCPHGFHGEPSRPFAWSPLSGDSWENVRCGECGAEGGEGGGQCKCDGSSSCSMNQHISKDIVGM